MPVWGICESLLTERPSSIEMHTVKRDLVHVDEITDAYQTN